MLISFAVTAKLICVFVFAYAKSRFSHDEADFIHENMYVCILFVCIFIKDCAFKYLKYLYICLVYFKYQFFVRLD